jgi:biopolymer transport protein ExbD
MRFLRRSVPACEALSQINHFSLDERGRMPVKLNAKSLGESAEARIEIVPLIDIMFFLLAAFMLVSLSMTTMKSVPVNLPTATTATPDIKKDLVDISVDKTGGIFLDKKPMADNELVAALTTAQHANPKLRVFISGDQEARHGAIMHALDLVRSAGIEKVAFEIRSVEKGKNS